MFATSVKTTDPIVIVIVEVPVVPSPNRYTKIDPLARVADVVLRPDEVGVVVAVKDGTLKVPGPETVTETVVDPVPIEPETFGTTLTVAIAELVEPDAAAETATVEPTTSTAPGTISETDVESGAAADAAAGAALTVTVHVTTAAAATGLIWVVNAV